MKKSVIGILCGGFSSEKEISFKSGLNVLNNLSEKLWASYLIKFNNNKWYVEDKEEKKYTFFKKIHFSGTLFFKKRYTGKYTFLKKYTFFTLFLAPWLTFFVLGDFSEVLEDFLLLLAKAFFRLPALHAMKSLESFFIPWQGFSEELEIVVDIKINVNANNICFIFSFFF